MNGCRRSTRLESWSTATWFWWTIALLPLFGLLVPALVSFLVTLGRNW